MFSLVEIDPVILEFFFIFFINLFFYHYYLQLKVGVAFIKTTWISVTQGCFVTCLLQIGRVVLEKGTFKIIQCTLLSRYYLLLEIARPFVWTNMIPLLQKNTFIGVKNTFHSTETYLTVHWMFKECLFKFEFQALFSDL